MIKCIGFESRPGTRCNEDRADTFGSFAWVIDGATGLTSKRFLPGESDAAWFADAWSRSLKAQCRENLDPLTIIQGAFESVSREIRSLVGGKMETEDYPALALSFVKFNGHIMEVRNVGDCSVIAQPAGDIATRIGSSKVDYFDGIALSVFLDRLDKGDTYESAFEVTRAQILNNRKKANTEEGYWVVDPSGRWLDKIQSFSLDFQSGDVLLATDGFTRAVDVYKTVSTLDGLLELSRREGLGRIIDNIRELEANDPECRLYPRLKPADDATAIMLRYEAD